MRLGCGGCLTAAFLLLVGGAAVGGTLWGAFRAFQEPEFHMPAGTPADGVRVQQKFFEIARRGGRPGRSGSAEPVSLSEPEVNAFLSHHLADAAELPLTDIGVRLVGDGVVEVAGRLPLRHLLSEPPVSAAADLLPERWLGRPVWLRLRARVRVEPGAARGERRYLRLDLEEFKVGRQRLPAPTLRHLLSPAALRVLRWQVPNGVEAITIEAGRAVIRTAS